ncbi:MraY family glycosyltransferase [Aerococcaceae bacterium WGS1372]
MAVLQLGGWSILLTLMSSLILTWTLVKTLGRDSYSPPQFGGVAVFCSFWLGFFVLFPTLLGNSPQWNIFLASAIVLVTGILDDYLELKPWHKSVGILMAANMIYFMTDVTFSSILIAGVPDWLFDTLAYVLTIGWVYFVTNAVNLLDGLDGLVSSVSITSLVTLTIMTYISSLSIRLTFIMMLVLLATAILGFLPFNWYPAKIYLGDTGALFIGFMFATLTVYNLKNVSLFSLIIPILFYAVPLFDTSYAIIRRMLSGQSMVEKDEDHLHHRLLRYNFSVTQIVRMMIFVTGVFSVIAILSQQYLKIRWLLVFISLFLIILLTFFMNYLDKK